MNRRLRIGIVANFLPSVAETHRGRANYERVKALTKLADVQAFCLEPDYPRLKFFQSQRSLYTAPAGEGVPGATVENLRYRAVPLLTRAVNGQRCAEILTPRLREFQPDLLIGFFVYPTGFGALAAGQKLGIPTIIGAVGSDLRRMNGMLIGRLVRKTVTKAEFVLTVSEELRQRAIAMGASPDKCRTIYHGCDPEIFHPGNRPAARAQLKIEDSAELVLFVGNLIPLKGVRELLEAAALLIPQRPDLRVVCIGAGPLEREFRARASKPDLKDRVRFIGGAAPQEVARWLAAANVLCLPSHSEGAPDVIIEALSCGRPVVATNVGGIPELVNSKCGILVPPKDARRLAAALSEALDRVWNDGDIAGCFSRTWEDWARETYEVCCSVVRARSANASPRESDG